MLKLVGISGKGGSGKTTFAKHAISLFGGTKIALADAVKEEVAAFLDTCLVPYEKRHLFGSQADRAETIRVQLNDWLQTDYRVRRILNPHARVESNNITMTYRQLLQLWGTEYRRGQDPGYWVKVAQRKIEATGGLIFVDDVRFPDEVKMVQRLGGFMVRITRPGGPFIDFSGHPSETALDGYNNFHWAIYNGGSLEDFHKEVEKVVGYMI